MAPTSPERDTLAADASGAAAGASPRSPRERPGIDRRSLLTGGAAGAGLGAVLGLGAAVGIPAIRAAIAPDRSAAASAAAFGGESLPCHGPHQAGVITEPTTHVRFVAYRLKPTTDRAAIERLFRILTDDVEGLTSGDSPLADPEPELAARPARLTITVGVGPDLVDRVGPGKRPEWLAPLPKFSKDRLAGTHDGGDLLFLIQADDQLAVAHAARMLQRDTRSFADRHWEQQGFRTARGSEKSGTTMRNLMGQVDGTVNPHPEDEDFAPLVWLGEADPSSEAGSQAWLAGGTALVLRRIRMELDTWDQIDRPGREQTIGRRLSDGAPLTGGTEHSPMDFDAKDEQGLPVIPSFAHSRRAHSEDPNERIFRRAVNYDEGGESGLLFACYQRNPLRQFVPIQQRLDELDLLNEWITHTGSAVFAILPGFSRGEILGQSLLS
ncbi:Dyp-type peroxidase [Leucobacter sp. CSA2]|uniref:Dyp-type peroxidase n=1 Tax=Leucobacter edaphi TaxID=2796472 RepID=A0A934QB71_9MICO|nr:Dyp-type peroxidase [Leucobacter edaphi]MBK0420913.1 Dyp-type peroxidase [Leucobacter edaphi]